MSEIPIDISLASAPGLSNML